MLDLILKRKFGISTLIKEILFLFAAILVFPDVWLSYLSKKTLEEQQRMDIVIYAGATVGSLALTTFRVFLFFIVSLRSSQRLHDRMVKAILHTQPSFFDKNPTGRILNRFSRDIGTMDEQLPPIFISCIQDSLFVFLRCPCTSYCKCMVVIDLLPNCSGVYTSRKILLKDLSRA